MSLISRKKSPFISFAATLLALVMATQAWSDTDTSTTAGIGSFGQNGYSVTGNAGSMVSSIPIDAPAGHHGLTPRIALSYNSQSKGNGLWGFGWGLSIGTIVRSGPRGGWDNLLPGSNESTSLTENHYSIDLFGSVSELTLVDPLNKIFHTRQETFSIVKGAVAPFDKWIAWDKAGIQYQFEQIPKDPPAGQERNILYLTSVHSPTGGWITVEYTETTSSLGGGTKGMIRPSKISYGGPGGTGIIPGTVHVDEPINGGESGPGGGSLPGGWKDPGTGTQTYYYIIEFKWKPRTDQVVTAVAGELYSLDSILDAIEVKHSTEGLIRKYKMTYETSWDSKRSLLKTAEIVGKDEVSQGLVMTFGYSTNSDVVGGPWDSGRWVPEFLADHPGNQPYLIDLDGDTLPDQIWGYRLTSSDDGRGYRLNDGDPFPYDNAPQVNFGPVHTEAPPGWFWKEIGCDKCDATDEDCYCPDGYVDVTAYAQFGDVDGDGRPDIIRNQQYAYDNPSKNPEMFDGLIANGISDFAGEWSAGPDAVPVEISTQKGGKTRHLGVIVADVNGDGLADYLKGERSVAAEGMIDNKDGTESYPMTDYKAARVRQTGKASSDGPRDLAKPSSYSSSGGPYTPPTTFYEWNQNPYNRGEFQTMIDQGIRLADLNGDGLVDLIGGYGISASGIGVGPYKTLFAGYGVWLNTGKGWSDNLMTSTTWKGPDGAEETDKSPSFVYWQMGYTGGDVATEKKIGYSSAPEGWNIADVNGDGLTDLVIHDEEGGAPYDGNVPTPWVYCYLNRGGLRWEEQADCRPPFDLGWGSDYRLMDVNGDGFTDIVWSKEGFNGGDKVYFNRYETPDLLTSIKNPFGATTSISYRVQVTPHIERPGHMVVPYKIQTRSSPTAEPLTQEFEFDDPVIGEQDWPRAREFRGYRVVKTSTYTGDSPSPNHVEPDRGTETRYLTSTDLVGSVESVRSWEGKSTQTTRLVNYSYTPDSNGAPPYFRPVEWATTQEFNPYGTNPDRTTEMSYTYDDYGNITKEQDDGDVAVTGDESIVNRVFAYNPSKWIMGNIRTESFSAWIPANAKMQLLRTTNFYYDDYTELGKVDIGLLTKTEKTGDQVPNPGAVTEFQYDPLNHNLIQEKDGVTQETVTHVYDLKMGLFEISSTSSVGTKTSSYYGVYEDLGDQPFGKLAKVTRPDGTFTTFKYDALGRLKETASGGVGTTDAPKSKYFYMINPNGAGGAKIRTQVLEMVGRSEIWRTSDSLMDGLGRVIRTTSENEEGALAIHQKTDYWTMGQVRRKYVPVEKLIPSDVDFTLWTESFYDSLGRVTKIVSPLGTVTNTYKGLTVESRDEGGHLTTSTMDAHGKAVKVVDPSGTTSFLFDGAGRLLKITDTFNAQTNFTYDGFDRKLTATTPDTGTAEWTYDEAGDLETETDAKGQTITHFYDTLGRETKRDLNGVTELTYGYDTYPTDIFQGAPASGEMANPKGHPTWIRNPENFTAWYYDGLGRQRRERRNFGDETKASGYQTKFAYDLMGKTLRIDYPSPSNLRVDYLYNAQGLVERVSSGSSSWVSSVNYDEAGRATAVVYGNRERRTTEFDPKTKRMTQLKIERLDLTTDTALATDLDHRYFYNDPANPSPSCPLNGIHGELCQITDQRDTKRTRTFLYDGVHRMTQEKSTTGGQHDFFYRGNGTIDHRVDNGVTTNYINDLNKHAVKTLEINGKTVKQYTYNANGDVETITNSLNGSNSKQTFGYSPDGRVTGIAGGPLGIAYYYDANRTLVMKYTLNGTTTTSQLFVNPYFERITTTGSPAKHRAYVMVAGKRLGVVETTETATPTQVKYWQHMNHQGSIELVTKLAKSALDTTSRVVDRFFYDAYGNSVVVHEGGDSKANYRFTGQRLDEETGFYDYGPRMYDPKLGRFLQSDTIIPNAFDSQALDPYAYARNNPIRYTDPTGHFSWGSFGATLAGAVVGTVVGLATHNPALGAEAGFMTTAAINTYRSGGNARDYVGNMTGVGMAWGAMGFGSLAMAGNPLSVIYGLANNRSETLGALAASAVAFGLSQAFQPGDSLENSEEAEPANPRVRSYRPMKVGGFDSTETSGEEWDITVNSAPILVLDDKGMAAGSTQDDLVYEEKFALIDDLGQFKLYSRDSHGKAHFWGAGNLTDPKLNDFYRREISEMLDYSRYQDKINGLDFNRRFLPIEQVPESMRPWTWPAQ